MPYRLPSSPPLAMLAPVADWFRDPAHLGILGTVLLVLGLAVLFASVLVWARSGPDRRDGEPEEEEFLPLPGAGNHPSSSAGAVRSIPVREPERPQSRPIPSVELFPEDWGVLGEIPGAVVVLFHGRIRCGTREFAGQIGVPPESLVGREFKEFIAPEDLLRVVEQLTALDRGERLRCHLSARLRGGAPGRAPASLTAVRVPYGGEHMVLVSFSPVLVTAVGPFADGRAPAPAATDAPAAAPAPPPAAVGPDPSTGEEEGGDGPEAAPAPQPVDAAAEFLATVSHELQTPLVSVRGYTELILKGRMGPLTYEQEKALQVVLRNVDRLIERIDELLAFSRPAPAASGPAHKPFPLWEVIDEAIEMVQEKTERRGITVTTTYETEDLRVRGDRKQIQRVFSNLLHNAVKFNRDGGSVRVAVRERSPEFLEVEVRDTGIGIPRQAQPRIFERYFRAGTPESTGREGTGLGLSIVKSILDQHRCTIRLSSEVSVGSTFTFTLPRAAVGVGSPAADRGGAGYARSGPAGRPGR